MKHALASSALLMVTVVLPGSAQSLSAPSEWSLTNAQGGFCIQYLVDPVLAAKLAPKDAVLAPAGRGEGLFPSLTRQVLDEPKFAGWIPATFCIGLYWSVAINDKVVAQMKGNQPIMVLTHTIAASSYKGAAVPAVLIGFFTDNTALQRAGEAVGQAIDMATRTVTEREGADFPSWLIEVKGIKLRWVGGPTGESRVLPTRSVSFGYTGLRGNVWNGAFQLTIPEAHTLVGSLGVEGKNDLAKALKGSPDRPVGAMESGGNARISFTPLPKR